MARRPGEIVVLRELSGGRIWRAAPWIVVHDLPDQLALYLPRGVDMRISPGSRMAPGGTVLEARVADMETLRLSHRGDAHSVLLWWRDGAFLGWYVNLERPPEPTPLGFDYVDHELDVFVHPDGTWDYEDEDEFEEAGRIGLLTPDEADRVRGEARRVVRRIERWAPPFSDGWESWRPNPCWPAPSFPPGWEAVD